ncbi:LIM domain-containing protein WLIM2a [Hibiscus syriacus]|uniref:LIM domain-containing protein WLIM2a n=1 Tax=Hibiscus syriacus TaxID=106335 RepID=A0A6A2YB97_HIBSY|nr:LIM domain-containing protein WLIM2a [Hibiscus syriacus]
MATFAGTQQKCMACNKTVYLVDKLTADNRVFHKACFRCHHRNGTLKECCIAGLTTSNSSREPTVLTRVLKEHQRSSMKNWLKMR